MPRSKTRKRGTSRSIRSPACSEFTEVGRLIGALSGRTDPARVESLASLDDSEEQRLTTLRADLAQEPKALATRLRSYKRRLETAIEKLRALHDAASEDSAARLRALADDLAAKREASRFAATALFETEPLPDVGSETWRSLWEAARAYFVEAAYPEVAFPKTGDDARCVLCQQPLSAEASDRLSRFEQFIRNSTQAEEEDAAQAIESFRDGLSASRLSLEAVQSMTALLKGDLDKSDIADQVRRFAVSALWHLRSILPSGRKPNSVIPALPEEAVSSVCVDLERRAAALTADADSPERKALQRELAELEDRLWLAGIKEDVLLEIARRKEIEALEQAAQHTRHNEITRKSSECVRGARDRPVARALGPRG